MQEPLFFESVYDAARQVVLTAGGPKKVASRLWPNKSAAVSHTFMLNCLDANRAEKFSPDDLLGLCKIGREVGCHALMNFLCCETGYDTPKPVEPEDERARLQREFIEAQKAMLALAGRMERAGMLRAVA